MESLKIQELRKNKGIEGKTANQLEQKRNKYKFSKNCTPKRKNKHTKYSTTSAPLKTYVILVAFIDLCRKIEDIILGAFINQRSTLGAK